MSPHNPMIKGDLLYVSWYEAGVLVFDLRDPYHPVQKGRFDTYSGPLALVTGCWGVYPFLGPDRILASDTETGLYVLSNQTAHVVTITGGDTFTDKNFGVCQGCGCN
jgi:hypothetical protein